MARRFQNRLQRRSGPSNKGWVGTVAAEEVNVPAASKVLLNTFVLSNMNIDETVLRTVGQISINSDNFAATEEQRGAFGLIVVSDAAVAVGITAIPGPITDVDDDGWFVYIPFSYLNIQATSVGRNPDAAHRIEFDSKAKRVFQEGQQIAIVVENAHAAHGFDIAPMFRMLTMVRGTG